MNGIFCGKGIKLHSCFEEQRAAPRTFFAKLSEKATDSVSCRAQTSALLSTWTVIRRAGRRSPFAHHFLRCHYIPTFAWTLYQEKARSLDLFGTKGAKNQPYLPFFTTDTPFFPWLFYKKCGHALKKRGVLQFEGHEVCLKELVLTVWAILVFLGFVQNASNSQIFCFVKRVLCWESVKLLSLTWIQQHSSSTQQLLWICSSSKISCCYVCGLPDSMLLKNWESGALFLLTATHRTPSQLLWPALML